VFLTNSCTFTQQQLGAEHQAKYPLPLSPTKYFHLRPQQAFDVHIWTEIVIFNDHCFERVPHYES